MGCSCAMSNHGTCAHAGMLLLPHGTHKHLSRGCARLAGTRTTSGCLLHTVRQWRLRGLAAAVPVLLDVRVDACRGHGLLVATHTAHVDACDTFHRLLGLESACVSAYPPCLLCHPCMGAGLGSHMVALTQLHDHVLEI